MGIRYDNRSKTASGAETIANSRGQKRVEHYTTPRHPDLTKAKRLKLIRIKHVWKVGDKFWNLACEPYDDASLWWLIAWYNQKPTEAHITLGDVIIIPKPLDKILSFYYRE